MNQVEEKLLHPPPGSRIEAAREYGIDLMLLIERLRRTPEARLSDFEKALTVLAEAKVRFVIVGGLAVTIHGSAYVTYDLDFCYARDAENLSRLVRVLQPYNPRLRGA